MTMRKLLARMGAGLAAMATLAACGSETKYEQKCFYGNTTYELGTSFTDGCNSCSCNQDGSVSCTQKGCVDCNYEGESYVVGDSFPAGDGCNLCTCMAKDEVSCTTASCGATCIYGGKKYSAGESFPSLDGCNTCECTEDGGIGCTEKACPCDPEKEWWREYVADSPEECAVIDYACPPNTTGFSNACGCGCEQDASCPEFLDCKPPKDCSGLKEQCPYSKLAL